MESKEETARKAEALKAIYRTDGVDLAEDEAIALAKHLREQTVLVGRLVRHSLAWTGCLSMVRFML